MPAVQNTTISGCNTILFNGTTYIASTIVKDTIRSVQGCDSVYKITNLVITSVVPVIQNTTISNCNTIIFNGTTYTTSTIVKDTIRSVQGCDSVYKITNLVITPIVPVIQNTTISNCNTIIFNGTTYTTSTIVKDTIRSVQGCDSVYKITNIVITAISPVMQNTTINGCKNVIFNGTTYTASTIVKDTIRSVQGCDSVYKITNIVITPIIPALQNKTITGCNKIIFNGTTYTSSIIIHDTTRGLMGCDSVYTMINILINNSSVLTKDTTIKSCGSLTFKNILYTTSTQVKDTVRTLTGCDSVYKNVSIIIEPNNFSLQLTSSANNVNPGTVVNLSVFYPLAYQVTSWQPVNKFVFQTANNQTIAADTNMNILVMAKSANGCIGSGRLLLTVNKTGDDIYFPSAFNPLSKVGNNSFGPLGNLSLLREYSLYVYNRWGMLIFFSNDPFQKWKGIYKGAALDPGTFVWQAKYLYKGILQKTKGNITLLK